IETNGRFVVECGNYIEQNLVPAFTNKLIAIKEMSKEEIELAYSKQYNDNIKKSPQDRLGMGLLEIAKTCSNNFSYEFIETSEKEMFFSLKISL
ncbi:MAG TPA: DUF6272 family protein, partial [Bacteroidia bacterium]|nr:DUF6272 family protein [Bacteroidia bacterium]